MTEEGEVLSPKGTSSTSSTPREKTKTTHKSQHKSKEDGTTGEGTNTAPTDESTETSKGKSVSSPSKRKSKTTKEKISIEQHKAFHLSMDPAMMSSLNDKDIAATSSSSIIEEDEKKKRKKKHESDTPASTTKSSSSRRDKKKKDTEGDNTATTDPKKTKKTHNRKHSSTTKHHHSRHHKGTKSNSAKKSTSKSTMSSHSGSVGSKSSNSSSESSNITTGSKLSASSSSSSSGPSSSQGGSAGSKSSASSSAGSTASTSSKTSHNNTTNNSTKEVKNVSTGSIPSMNIDASLIEMIDRTDAASLSERPNLLGGTDAEEMDEIVSGRWEKSAIIGVGFQGTTYSGTWIKNKRPVAIKEFRSRQLSSSHLQQLEHIAPLLEGLDHSCVVRYYGLCVEDKRLYSMTELVTGSSLQSIVREYGPFPEDLVAACIGQALYGLAYLHAKGVPHGAVHANNIIMNFATGECKLSDICLKILAEQQPSGSMSGGSNGGSNGSGNGSGIGGKSGFNPVDYYATNGAYSVYGRPNWLPPEVVEMEGPVSPAAADIWAVGCTCVELLTGAPPYAEHKHPIAVLNAILTAKEPPIPDAVSEELREFLGACFERDPAKRPDPVTLRSHPFITKLVGTSLADCISRGAKFIARHCDAPPNDNGPASGAPGMHSRTGFGVSSIAETVTESEEAEALSSANECLTKFKSQIDLLEDKIKQKCPKPDNTDNTDNADNAAKNGNGDSNDSNAFVRLGKEVLPVLRRCARLQDFLITFAVGMRSKYMNACRDEARTNQMNSLWEAEKDKAEREYEVALGAVQAITDNTLRLEERLLSSKETKDGVYGLAKILYGKLSGDTLGGSCAGLLEVVSTEGAGEAGAANGVDLSDTKWKPSWVVLRDNFVFFFKSGAVNSPTGIIHLPKLRGIHVGPTNGRSFCFTIANSGVLFSATSFEIANDWVLAINRSTTWFEYGEYTLEEQRYKEPIFGVSARDLALRDPTRGDPNLPSFFNVLVDDVIRKGLCTEGILRVAGSVTSIEALKSAFEVTPRAVDVDLEREDVHCVVGLMKGWLRQLPNFLTAEETKAFVAFMAAHPKPGPADAQNLRRFVGRHMQPSIAAVVRRLCELILRIAAHEAQNKMSVDNALICVISSLAIQPAIFTYLLMNYTLIFGPLKEI